MSVESGSSAEKAVYFFLSKKKNNNNDRLYSIRNELKIQSIERAKELLDLFIIREFTGPNIQIWWIFPCPNWMEFLCNWIWWCDIGNENHAIIVDFNNVQTMCSVPP